MNPILDLIEQYSNLVIFLGVKHIRKPHDSALAQSTSFLLNLVGVAPDLASVTTLAASMLNVIVTKVLRHKGSLLVG
jgi:hypothetical protein